MNNLLFPLSFTLLFTACSVNHTPPSLQHSADGTGIVGGSEVQIGDKVSLSTVGIYDTEGKFLCTGTLIAKDLVLTAGHCIGKNPTKMIVFFGFDFKGAKKENIRTVLDAKAHPNFAPDRTENTADIGLIRINISKGLPLGYLPAQILKDYSVLQKSTKVVVAGFGLNWSWIVSSGAGKLRTTTLEVLDPEFSKTEIALSQSLGHGVCSGDSGGPAYFEQNSQLFVWGVVSRGDSLPIALTPDCFLFSLLTRIDSYSTWIQNFR